MFAGADLSEARDQKRAAECSEEAAQKPLEPSQEQAEVVTLHLSMKPGVSMRRAALPKETRKRGLFPHAAWDANCGDTAGSRE
jgi:hypothetical protein